jgi:hypothetical protein
MRPKTTVAKKGEAPPRMVCAVTGKAVQSGATAVSLSETHWCYVNPGKILTEERRVELLALTTESKVSTPGVVAPKSAKRNEGEQ